MASLSGQQGAGSKDNPPGKSSSGEHASRAAERYLGDSGGEGKSQSQQGKSASSTTDDKSTGGGSETTRTSNALSGLGSSDELYSGGGPTAGEYAGRGSSGHTENQRSLAEGAPHG